MVSSKDLREEFVLDFVKMCSVADIPLEKADKMKPFVLKHCKNGGTLPVPSTLRKVYVPKVFDIHLESLKQKLNGVSLSIIADETSDIRDKSVLNIVAGVHGEYFLIDVQFLQACNHATLSQAITKTVISMGIDFKNVMSVVTDSAAYCKKAYREIMKPLFPNSVHILCLAHIVNLTGEVFHNFPAFGNLSILVNSLATCMNKKPARKLRYITFIKEFLPENLIKNIPAPSATRWNSWFEVVIYHSTHLMMYEGFLKKEVNISQAIERVLELLTNKEIYQELQLQIQFISENCIPIMSTLKFLEDTHLSLAMYAFDKLEYLRTYLQNGTSKESFGVETDLLLNKIPPELQGKFQKSFHDVFSKSLSKLEIHLLSHPAYDYYKAVRIFNPKLLGMIPHQITKYECLPGLRNPSMELIREFESYCLFDVNDIPEDLDIVKFWQALGNRLPLLSAIALDLIWLPVASVDVERSFSQYKHLLDDRRTSLTEENTRQLMMLYFNKDIEKRFN